MVGYKKIYLDYYGLTTQDWIACLGCGGTSIDIHHLIFKSQGGKDVIENLAAVCRECHIKAHSDQIFNQSLIQKNNDIL